MKTCTPQAMQALEKHLFDNHIISPLELMKKAAKQMYMLLRTQAKSFKEILVLCGKGNNAGDGYELASLLRKDGLNVVCASVFGEAPTVEPAHTCYQTFLACNGIVLTDSKSIFDKLHQADVIIDAVFGIGFHGSIPKETLLYSLIDEANHANAYRVALDVPSGVCSADGSVGGIAFVAHLTLTVLVPKIGMLSYPARFFCGWLETVEIGVPPKWLESFESVNCFVTDECYLRRKLVARNQISNKGDYGKLLCICGSEHMTGAAVLSVGAALRTGTGLVTLASEKAVLECVRVAYPEPIYRTLDWTKEDVLSTLCKSLSDYTAVLIGCGLGRSAEKAQMVEAVLKKSSAPVVLDADGINMIASCIECLQEAKATPILTPHPGEFARLSGKTVDYINDHRIECATEFAIEHSCVLVLKGAGTVIAAPNGHFAVNPTGNAGLAKGGSGDVLAGVIAGLLAQSALSPFEAAVCGVYLHGVAGDVLKEKISESGYLPSELAMEIGRLLP